MPELIPTATEAEWLAARRQGITASEIAVVMGLSPWSSPYKLYHQKLGILPRDEVTPAMERGTTLEPYVRQKFAEAHPEFAVMGFGRDLYRHAERPWQMATLDALLYAMDDSRYFDLEEPVAVAEFKTTTDMSEWGEPGTDDIPVHYRAQVLWQCDVMGVRRWHVAVLDVRRWEISEYSGEIDEAACKDQRLMMYKSAAFLMSMDFGHEPDVDYSPATIGALKALHPSLTDEDAIVGDRLAANYRAAARNEKHWEQRKRLYEARIREQMGSAKRAFTAVGSEPVCRRDVYTVREHTRRESTVDKLVIIPPKKDKKHEHADSE